MKNFIIFLLLTSLSSAMSIDTTLFEGENISNHFEEIEKDINNSISMKLKNKKIISLEKSTLKKLKEIYKIKDKIEPFKTIEFNNRYISQQEYFQALYLISTIKNEITHLQKKDKSIQEILFKLKSSIENRTTDDKNQSLLNYQLQYAFYKITQKKISKSLKQYKLLFDKEFFKFKSALKRINFQEHNSKNIIKNANEKIDTIKKKNLLLDIDKVSNVSRDKKIKKQIIKEEEIIKKETDATIIKKLKAQILLSLKSLQEKKQKEFIDAITLIENDTNLLTDENRNIYKSMTDILIKFEDEKFDTTSTTIVSTKIGLNSINENILKLFNKTIFVYEEKAFSLKTIFTFILLLIIGFIVAKLYKNFVDSFHKQKRIKSLSTARMVANSGYYIIILISLFIAFRAIGLDMHTIFVIIGAILLWIILGLQGFISNYAMGILMKIDRSIRIGDHIEIDSQIVGSVDDMDFRSVTIITSDNTRYCIPNSRFISNSFINHSLEDTVKRIHIPFSAKNTIDYEIIENIVLNALSKSNIAHIETIDKKSQVIITDINRKIVRYSLLVWINQKGGYDMSVEKSAFLSLIHKNIKNI
jgi:small-conductance mechanosensitive channel